MDNSNGEENLNEPLITNNRDFKIAITFYFVLMVFLTLHIKTRNFTILHQNK